jgi:hypothetical protein
MEVALCEAYTAPVRSGCVSIHRDSVLVGIKLLGVQIGARPPPPSLSGPPAKIHLALAAPRARRNSPSAIRAGFAGGSGPNPRCSCQPGSWVRRWCALNAVHMGACDGNTSLTAFTLTSA